MRPATERKSPALRTPGPDPKKAHREAACWSHSSPIVAKRKTTYKVFGGRIYDPRELTR